MDRDPETGDVIGAWNTCPICKRQYETLADEFGLHTCPRGCEEDKA